MPIFARRRLQIMITELQAVLPPRKANDLLRRLESKKTQDAIAAEYECGLLWALCKFGRTDIEPVIPGTKSVIDAVCTEIFPGQPTAIEITAISDDAFSGKDDMDRTANKIVAFAKRVHKDADKHLYFEFNEQSSHATGKYVRSRCVDSTFKMTPELEQKLRGWLQSRDPFPSTPLRIVDGQTDVAITWRERVSPAFRTHCRMPPVAYDVEDNSLFKALERKGRQFAGIPADYIRCIFVGDAGCSMLRSLKAFSSTGREIGGESVIHHFLTKSKVSAVCVFAPDRRSQWGFGPYSTSVRWKVTLFTKSEPEQRALPAIQKVAMLLPKPRLEGYQARSLHVQGSFKPQAPGNYLGMHMKSNGFNTSIHVSARLLLELLAGRITLEQFHRRFDDGRENIFANHLASGFTIQKARLESAGIDEDDDHFVIEFGLDAAARPLELNRSDTQDE